MPPRVRMTFAAMSLALMLIPGVALYTELSKRSDIWWTPRTMLVPLSESADRVEVEVRHEPLVSLLAAGQLRLVDGASASVLSASDIGFRFNNWDRIRSQRLLSLLVYAAVIGAGVVVFLLLVTGRLAYRGERPVAE